MTAPMHAVEWVRKAKLKPDIAGRDIATMIATHPHDYANMIATIVDDAVAGHAPHDVVHDLRRWHTQTAAGMERLAAHPYLQSVIGSMSGVNTSEGLRTLLHAAAEKAPTAAERQILQTATHQFDPPDPHAVPPVVSGFSGHACVFCAALGVEFGPAGILAGCVFCGLAGG